MADKIEKEFEEAAEGMVRSIGKLLKQLLCNIGKGIKKLKHRKFLMGFLIAVLMSEIGYLFRSNIILLIDIPLLAQYILLSVVLGTPVWYLLIIGGQMDKSQESYKKIFSEIGFRGKDGSYPVFCESYLSGKKKILIFKSVISLQEWKGAKGRLETGFDCNILKIETGSGKRVIKLTTVPSDCVIPDLIRWQDSYVADKNGIMTVGQGALKNITFDLNRTPHVLIAGETGSGKSVILRSLLWQMICQNARVYMFDFKGGVEFGKQYEKYGEVVTERARALEILDKLTYENQSRLTIFRDLEVKNLPEYNEKTGQNLCRIGLFCDEIGEMMDKKGIGKEEKELFEKIEGRLSTLARLSRATGINLFLGVQRPDANILPGQIKNNIPIRISGRFADKAASEIVLGNSDACELPDIKGRFLYRAGNDIVEFQAYFFEDDVLHNIPVTVGDMLSEAPSYSTDLPAEIVPPATEHQETKTNKRKSKTASKGLNGMTYTSMDLRESKEVDELLRQMDDYDLQNLF